jgi:hypothetical protein
LGFSRAEQEIRPPAAAAKVTIGDHMPTAILLKLDHVADISVLDCREFRVRVRTQIVVGIMNSEQREALLAQRRRTEKAADVIDMKVRCGHLVPPCFARQSICRAHVGERRRGASLMRYGPSPRRIAGIYCCRQRPLTGSLMCTPLSMPGRAA